MSDEADAPGLTPPTMDSRAMNAPPAPVLPPDIRLAAASPPALPPTAPSQRPTALFQPSPTPVAVAATRPAGPKQRRSVVTMFVVVVVLAGLAAGGLLALRMVRGTANDSTAIAATPSTEATIDGVSTLPSTAVAASPTPAGWVNVVEQTVGFSLPTTTERVSAWLLDPNGQAEGPNSAQYAITPGGGAIFVIWDGGDPAGREKVIVDQVARVPGIDGAPTITNWTPIPSRIGTAISADSAYEGPGLGLGAGRLLVWMTPTAVVVVKYLSTDDPKVIDSVFRSITIDGKPAF